MADFPNLRLYQAQNHKWEYKKVVEKPGREASAVKFQNNLWMQYRQLNLQNYFVSIVVKFQD